LSVPGCRSTWFLYRQKNGSCLNYTLSRYICQASKPAAPCPRYRHICVATTCHNLNRTGIKEQAIREADLGNFESAEDILYLKSQPESNLPVKRLNYVSTKAEENQAVKS